MVRCEMCGMDVPAGSNGRCILGHSLGRRARPAPVSSVGPDAAGPDALVPETVAGGQAVDDAAPTPPISDDSIPPLIAMPAIGPAIVGLPTSTAAAAPEPFAALASLPVDVSPLLADAPAFDGSVALGLSEEPALPATSFDLFVVPDDESEPVSSRAWLFILAGTIAIAAAFVLKIFVLA